MWSVLNRKAVELAGTLGILHKKGNKNRTGYIINTSIWYNGHESGIGNVGLTYSLIIFTWQLLFTWKPSQICKERRKNVPPLPHSGLSVWFDLLQFTSLHSLCRHTEYKVKITTQELKVSPNQSSSSGALEKTNLFFRLSSSMSPAVMNLLTTDGESLPWPQLSSLKSKV